MPLVWRLTRILMLNRARTQRNLRFVSLGTSVLVVLMMFVVTRTKSTQLIASAEGIEYSAWRVLAGLVFTIIAMGLAEMGSDTEQEYLTTLGLRGSSYFWAKLLNLGLRGLPWLLWGTSWAVATTPSIPGHPFWIMASFALCMFLYALTLGGCLGFGLETLLRRLKNGQQATRAIAMLAPLALVITMMGTGNHAPVPQFLHKLSWLTPIAYFHVMLYEDQQWWWLAAALATLAPWVLGLSLLGLVWDFRRDVRALPHRWKARANTGAVTFGHIPFVHKDFLMLRRYGWTLFRGVIAAAALVVPFSFLNVQAAAPLFLRFFEVMIIVAASGMLFGLMLPSMDKEVLWLVRVTGHVRSYVFQKFMLVGAATLGFSTLIVTPLSLTVGLPLSVIAPLVLVGSGLMTSLTLIASCIASRLGIDMVTLPDANLVMGTMFGFGLYIATTVLGYMVSWVLLVGALSFWSIATLVGLGLTIYLFETQEVA